MLPAQYNCTSPDDSRLIPGTTCRDGAYFESGSLSDVCHMCTGVANAAPNASYTCTGASDSRVSGCADGFYHVRSVTSADRCDACSSVDMPAASVDSCLSCSNGTASGCLEANCTPGYHSYSSATQSCAPCTPVPNASVGAAHTCTSASDSRVSGCAVGHYLDAGTGLGRRRLQSGSCYVDADCTTPESCDRNPSVCPTPEDCSCDEYVSGGAGACESIGAASSCIYSAAVPGTCHDATNEEPGYCGSSDPGEHHAHQEDACPEEGFSCSGRCDASYTCCDSGVCAPTPSCGQLNEYWCGLLAAAGVSDRDAAEVNHGGANHGEWYFHGSTTSIGTGQSGEACNSSLVTCAGGDVFGFGPAQAALVASFIQEWHILNNGTLPPTPECPAAGDILEPGDVSTAACAPGYTLCASCGYKCLSSAEHCPNVSRHDPTSLARPS